jgi:hypothetical protein
MVHYSNHRLSKQEQSYRFQRFREKVAEAIVSRVKKVIQFIHYGISSQAALRETLNMIRRLNISANAAIDKEGIQIIPL